MSTGMIIILAGLAFFILTCLAILDIASKDFGSIQMKAVWAIIVCLLPFAGVAIYFLFGFRKGKRRAAEAPAENQ
jgi:hypothetical protein